MAPSTKTWLTMPPRPVWELIWLRRNGRYANIETSEDGNASVLTRGKVPYPALCLDDKTDQKMFCVHFMKNGRPKINKCRSKTINQCVLFSFLFVYINQGVIVPLLSLYIIDSKLHQKSYIIPLTAINKDKKRACVTQVKYCNGRDIFLQECILWLI